MFPEIRNVKLNAVVWNAILKYVYAKIAEHADFSGQFGFTVIYQSVLLFATLLFIDLFYVRFG